MKRITVLFGSCLTALLVQSAVAQSTMQPATSSSSASSAHAACADDVKKLCPDAQDEKAMHTCLKAHKNDVSSGCKDAMKAHKAHKEAAEQAPKTQ